MNCTEQEFIDKISANAVSASIIKYFSQYNDPTGHKTIWVLSTVTETQLSHGAKDSLASHIWFDGVVIKDTTGLFTAPYRSPINASLQAINAHGNSAHNYSRVTVNSWYVGVDHGLESKTAISLSSKPLKCGCGAHSVNSNQHQDYCDLFNKESA